MLKEKNLIEVSIKSILITWFAEISFFPYFSRIQKERYFMQRRVNNSSIYISTDWLSIYIAAIALGSMPRIFPFCSVSASLERKNIYFCISNKELFIHIKKDSLDFGALREGRKEVLSSRRSSSRRLPKIWLYNFLSYTKHLLNGFWIWCFLFCHH